MKRAAALIAALLVALVLLVPTAAAAPPATGARVVVLMDAVNGHILSQQEGDARIFPASLTKVLTAVLVIERTQPTDVVTISALAANQEPVTLNTKAGETYTVRDLLYGLLLHSGNDVAVALAEHVSGSVEQFAALMNEKAKSIGALSSNFTNPSGLHDPNHYTTGTDMARIMRYALQNPTFADIIHTYQYTIVRPSGEQVKITNRNQLLNQIPGMIGGKTGYTDEAGECLLTAVQREQAKMILMTARSSRTGVWGDQTALWNYAFSGFSYRDVITAGTVVDSVPVKYGRKVGVAPAEPVGFVWGIDEAPPQLSQKVDRAVLTAPVQSGQPAGTVSVLIGSEIMAQANLVTTTAVQRYLWFQWWFWVLVVAGAAVLALIVVSVRRWRLRSRRRNFLRRY
jgi:D-alanyl-D-alanine carboxypeptidase (penicillin-binding protein 5/6)